MAEPPIPPVKKMPAAGVFLLFILISNALIAAYWHSAEAYNPEGNGLFNAAEATMANTGYVMVAAAAALSLVPTVAFGVALILQRLWNMSQMQHAAATAVLSELQGIRSALANREGATQVKKAATPSTAAAVTEPGITALPGSERT